MDQTNATFRALSAAPRRDILKLLRSGPRTSGQIADQFDSSWPTISRHLAVLREGGLVTTERQGQEIYYELNTSVFQDVIQQLLEWTTPKNPRAAVRRGRRQQEAS